MILTVVPEPIEPESAIPYPLRFSCVVALDLMSTVFMGWMAISAINSTEVLHYRTRGYSRVQTEEKIKEDGYVPLMPRKVNAFFYEHGEIGRRVTHWTYDKITSSFD